MTSCPNCGAPIDNYRYVKCPYCGTDYYDFAPKEMGKPFYMKFKNDGKVMIAKVMITKAQVTSSPRISHIYADNELIDSSCSRIDTTIDISLCVLNEHNGHNTTIVDTERME